MTVKKIHCMNIIQDYNARLIVDIFWSSDVGSDPILNTDEEDLLKTE